MFSGAHPRVQILDFFLRLEATLGAIWFNSLIESKILGSMVVCQDFPMIPSQRLGLGTLQLY